jgi:signal transduction histidine kinase
MKKPGFPKNESERQKSIERYQILDTDEEESFDNLTSLMANICETPISLVSLLDHDRNFLKSHFGIPFNEDPRERSFCGHTILEEDGVLIVPDATLDNRFHDNPLVTEMGVRFYAGSALVDTDGIRIGALCVFGTEPKILSTHQEQALSQLSKQVMILMQGRLLNSQLLETEKELQERYQELEKFAEATSHDLRSPLSSIIGLVEILKLSAIKKLTKEEQSYIDLIKVSAGSLSNYISGLLSFYKSAQLLKDELSQTIPETWFKELLSVFSDPENKVILHTTIKSLNLNKGAISQILMNLISNGLKYNESETPTVNVSITENKARYCFEVVDNGIGIPSARQHKIFELFEASQTADRNGNKGTGIGLATVKKLIDKLEGTINITSIKDEGSTFTCIIPKN